MTWQCFLKKTKGLIVDSGRIALPGAGYIEHRNMVPFPPLP